MLMPNVLDLGSGLIPDVRATDAVDLADRRELRNEEEQTAQQARDLGISEGELKKRRAFGRVNVKLKTGVDYNSGLPYPDEKFDTVVSHSSVAAFGKAAVYREARRVLKPGGALEVGAAKLARTDSAKVSTKMRKAGFTGIQVKKSQPDTRALVVGTPMTIDKVVGWKPPKIPY